MQTLSDLCSSYCAEGLSQVELCATRNWDTYGRIYIHVGPVEIQKATHSNLNARSMTPRQLVIVQQYFYTICIALPFAERKIQRTFQKFYCFYFFQNCINMKIMHNLEFRKSESVCLYSVV